MGQSASNLNFSSPPAEREEGDDSEGHEQCRMLIFVSLLCPRCEMSTGQTTMWEEVALARLFRCRRQIISLQSINCLIGPSS